MVKLGIYGIIRIALLLKSDQLLIGEIVIIISLLTGVFGILNASVHRDFKKMLAYCTIENIGIIGLSIGLFLVGESLNNTTSVSYTHLRAHETVLDLVCRLLLEKKKIKTK